MEILGKTQIFNQSTANCQLLSVDQTILITYNFYYKNKNPKLHNKTRKRKSSAGKTDYHTIDPRQQLNKTYCRELSKSKMRFGFFSVSFFNKL